MPITQFEQSKDSVQSNARSTALVAKFFVGPMVAIFVVVGSITGPLLWAGPTQVVRDDTFETLRGGELENAALSSDGFIYPSYKRESLGDSGTEIIWAAIDQGKRGIVCATGHEGKLVRINRKGEAEVIATVDDSQLTAIAELGDGELLVAGAPSGTLYLLNDDDELTTATTVDAKFVWALEDAGKDELWVATGAGGKLFKVSQKRDVFSAELAHEFPSKNLLDLWLDADGQAGEAGMLYVAGQDPAWLYRYDPKKDEYEVAYASEADEIRAIQWTEEGIAVATNTERAPSPQVLSLTLRMSGRSRSSASAGTAPKPASNGGAKAKGADMGDVFAKSEKKTARVPASEVILVTPEGFTRTLWTSPERPIHDMTLAASGELLVAAGDKGRIFELADAGRFSVVADLREDYIVSITNSEDGGVLGTAARNGVAFRVSGKPAKKSVYRSRIIDGGRPVQWGTFYWKGSAGNDNDVEMAIRQGNTPDPEEDGWGPWSKDNAIAGEKGVTTSGRAARYLQYRVTMKGKGGELGLPKTDYIEGFYRDVNVAPRVLAIAVGEAASPDARKSGGAKPSSGASAGGRNGSGAGKSANGGSPVQGGGREVNSNSGAITISWKASDPNGDALLYALYFKAEDESTWKLIDEDMESAKMGIKTLGIADGRYRFRVVVSDEKGNPPEASLEGERISDAFVVDNTPPGIKGIKTKERDGRIEITATVSDGLSFISSLNGDLDNDTSFTIDAADGFFDERDEELSWLSDKLESGEHVLTLAVTDRRGNTAVAKAVFTIR